MKGRPPRGRGNDGARVRRVGEAIKEIVAELLPGMKDPRLGFITVTDVRTSTDLRSAEVFYTTLPDDEETAAQTAEGLASAGGVLRREVGSRLGLRHAPELVFVHDPLPAQGRRIDELLRATGDIDPGGVDSEARERGDRGR